MSTKFVIIDGHSLAYRAFYALPPLTNAQGFVTNAVFGFYKMLQKMLEEEEPSYLAVAFDRGKKVFRHEYYPDYKGTRRPTPEDLKPQFAVLKELLKAMKIAVFEKDGYEADDLIGTLVKEGEKAGLSNLIVSGDKDVWQLISSQTRVFLTRRGISELEIYDPQVLLEKYGIKPEQVVEVKGLMGDASDNIPGIPGVGEKTALKLIKEYHSIENVLKQQADFQGKKLGESLANYGAQALLSKKLATIVTDVPLVIDLQQCRRKEPDYARFFALLRELEFQSILQAILQEREDLAQYCPQEKVVLASSCLKVNPQELKEYLATGQGNLTVYLETAKEKAITAWGVKWTEGEIYGTCSEEGEFANYKEILKPYLEDQKIKKTVYDAKTTILALAHYGLQIRGIEQDVLLMVYLLNPSRTKNDLPILLQEEFSQGPAVENLAAISFYVQGLQKLGQKLIDDLTQREMLALYREVELPLVQVLVSMENAGIKVDPRVLQEMGQDLAGRLTNLTTEIYKLAGSEFNLNSPKQLGEILFDKLGLPPGKKTKTGYSTNAEVLEGLAPQYEIAGKILIYRQMMKLKTTYIDGLSVLIEPVTSRIHTSFNQTVTATGRLSSTEPNLQNIPVRLPEGRLIRRAFLASPGHVLLSADYSQIELRVLAHLAEDEVMLTAFRENEDIHLRTAAEVFGLPQEMVTAEMRQAAKAVNFGIIYGISDFGLSRDLGIPRQEAQHYIEKYFARYSGVRDYLRRSVALAKKVGYATTLLKRRRYLPDLHSRNFHLRSFAERAAMNTPIQGSAADIIKLAMLELYQVLQEKESDIQLILQVHDELILDVPREKVVELGSLVKQIMTKAYPLQVPLKVDLQVGPDWYNLKKLGEKDA